MSDVPPEELTFLLIQYLVFLVKSDVPHEFWMFLVKSDVL